MRAAIFCGPHSIQVSERPDPVIGAPTDAVVRVVVACVCGAPIGHEFVGVVEHVGEQVRCRAGWTSRLRR